MSYYTRPQPEDDEETRALRKQVADAELKARLSEAWWTPPRMIAFALGVMLVFFWSGLLIAWLAR